MKKLLVLIIALLTLGVSTVNAGEIDWRDWKQLNGKWSAISMGDSTVMGKGSLPVSIGIQAKRSGATLNGSSDWDLMDFIPLILDGESVRLTEVSNVFDNFKYLDGATVDNIEELREYIGSAMVKGYYPVIQLNFYGKGTYLAVSHISSDGIIYVYDPNIYDTGVSRIDEYYDVNGSNKPIDALIFKSDTNKIVLDGSDAAYPEGYVQYDIQKELGMVEEVELSIEGKDVNSEERTSEESR